VVAMRNRGDNGSEHVDAGEGDSDHDRERRP
jgi:hypothetical protein